jgi:hypothetical protein
MVNPSVERLPGDPSYSCQFRVGLVFFEKVCQVPEKWLPLELTVGLACSKQFFQHRDHPPLPDHLLVMIWFSKETTFRFPKEGAT